jgi:alkanesulfonate monooxygenase SsuD/methylene tetrahydromethanopterin reductase-like flavin-dependent oxidoreductase (luciferase family)
VPLEELTDEHADQLLAAGASAQVDHMLTYTAAGPPADVAGYLDEFLELTGADELITVHQAPTIEGRLRSVTLLAEAVQTVTA